MHDLSRKYPPKAWWLTTMWQDSLTNRHGNIPSSAFIFAKFSSNWLTILITVHNNSTNAPWAQMYNRGYVSRTYEKQPRCIGAIFFSDHRIPLSHVRVREFDYYSTNLVSSQQLTIDISLGCCSCALDTSAPKCTSDTGRNKCVHASFTLSGACMNLSSYSPSKYWMPKLAS